MANFNLNSVALICEFNVSVWTARKLDRAESDKVVEGAGAKSKGAARVNKNLFSGRTELEDIGKLVTEARNYVIDNTIPWSDAGQRMLIGSRFPKFDKRVEDYRGEFYDKVNAFVDLYPTLITAQAMALGAMFNRAEFPPASEIAHKFAMNIGYLPVPTSGDIRVDIGNQAQDELRERLEKLSNQRVDNAVANVNQRFIDHLKRMADRLVTDVDDKTGEGKGRRYHDTLVTSAFELCDLANDYNITGDPLLSLARKTLEDALSGVTADTLREDPIKREDVRKTVTSILNRFQI
jgi:tetrahydromethanopterin S-methyltransferase subunit G